MIFGLHRHMVGPDEWKKICASDDENVTIENFGVGAYQFVLLIAGSAPPDPSEPVENFRTLKAQEKHTFTNLDEGTVLWAKAVNEPAIIEVVTG